MIAELVVFAAIVVIMGYMYLKGSIVRSFIFFINAIIASTVAISFFETAGRMLIGYGYGGQWIFMAVFVLIFAIFFILLLAISDKLAPDELYFGDLPDRVVRCIICIPLGMVLAGVLLIAVNLSPLPGKWPYERFDLENKNARPSAPDKSLILNADGLVAGFASAISKGSMAGSKSLDVFHPQLLNEFSLNRVISEESNPIMAGTDAITVKKAYEADSVLASSIQNRPAGSKLIVVETEIRNSSVKDGGALYAIETGTVTFTMGQVRLICKESPDTLTGTAEVIYPIGWLINETTLDPKAMTEEIKLTGADFPSGTKTLKFVFNIPSNTKPVMLQFKINAVDEITKLHKQQEEEI
ncbi:MAG: hypothetical protein A2Y10_13230 [Planctomycetes bacterium GWF2_41_51]|nr:MAG: hypothetical protein A2Y10_13230 [Planctomycetes bacterium GWF2_41_51]HBG27322.1 hypothetical protein [Phycisphaerales bacterium]